MWTDSGCSVAKHVWLLAVVGLCLLFATSPAAAPRRPHVAVIGCSNSGLVWESYTDASRQDVAWDGAVGAATLNVWAHQSAVWASFDSQYARYGATEVWYPLCVKAGYYPSFTAAWNDFVTFYGLLRKRTQAPLFLTDTLGDQEPGCLRDDDDAQAFVVAQAVTLGYAKRSTPDIPAASRPTADLCHFDPAASTNVGVAAARFLDG